MVNWGIDSGKLLGAQSFVSPKTGTIIQTKTPLQPTQASGTNNYATSSGPESPTRADIEDHEMDTESDADGYNTETAITPRQNAKTTQPALPTAKGKENRPLPTRTTQKKPRLSIRVPALSYASVLKRGVDQVEPDSPCDDPQNRTGTFLSGYDTATQPDPIHYPGPIKGFSAAKAFDNLDPVVRKEWECLIPGAILVYYLHGGFEPTMAQRVRTIAEDLEGKKPLKSITKD